MSNNRKKPGNHQAIIIAGPLCGSVGKVVDFFYEQDDTGTFVPDGLKGLILDIEGIGKRALWRNEVRLQR